MSENENDKDKDLGRSSGQREGYRDTDLSVGVSANECVCTMKRTLGALGQNQVDPSCPHHGDPNGRRVGADEENDLPDDPQAY